MDTSGPDHPDPGGPSPRRATLSVASFNVHMGVDGWGRPFDLVAECADLDADVLVLQEAWTPDDGSPGTAAQVASDLGYSVVAEAPLARARLYAPVDTATPRWAPRSARCARPCASTTSGSRSPPARGTVPPGGVRGASPSWPGCRAATSRSSRWANCAGTRRDAVIRCTVDVGGTALVVHGTHMSHITHLSPAQYRRLARLLPPLDRPALLTGDMNMWGPPAASFFKGWRRAVTGRTWPAHRPHSQLDHVLVTPAVDVVAARVAEPPARTTARSS